MNREGSLMIYAALLGAMVGALWSSSAGHDTEPDFLVKLSTYAQGIGAVGSMLVTTVIGIMVYRYTKRRDRLDLFLRRWATQQEINANTVDSDENLVAAEKSIWGQDADVDVLKARQYYQLFMRINMLQMLFFGYKEGLITKEEWNASSVHTAKLLANSRAVVKYLLEERGYAPEFARAVLDVVDLATPPNAPTDAAATA